MKPWPIVVALATIALMFGLARRFEPAGIDQNSYWAVFWGVAWLLASFWFAYLCVDGIPSVTGGPGKPLLFAWFLLSGVGGGAFGWLMGVFFFPTDTTQAQAFNKVETMVGALVSGFLLTYITDLLKYATAHENGKSPLIFTSGYRECLGFFVVSLLVSGGVQVAVRNSGEIRIAWDGADPSLSKDGRYQLVRGNSYQLVGAAFGSPKLAVRWRLEATADKTLQSLVSSGLISPTSDGKLSIAEDAKWSPTDPAEVQLDVVATAVGRPDLAKSVPVVIIKKP